MITIQIPASQAEAVIYLLEQGIELEKLKIEVNQTIGSNTIESYVKILHGEKFTSTLIAASSG